MHKSCLLVIVSVFSSASSVYADCYDQAFERSKQICGELEIKRTEIDIKIKAQAEAEANAIVKKFIGASASGTVDIGKSEIAGLADEELRRDRFEARGCRERMYSKIADQQCEKKPTYKTCSRPEFGILRYNNVSSADENSGWRGGGHNRNEWCNELVGRVVGRNGIGPDHNTKILGTDESSRKHGLGRVEYNYKCSVQIEYNPIYNTRQDPLCGIVGTP